MVVRLGNFYLYRTSIGLQCLEKQFNSLSLHKTFIRHLRGSRYGKGFDKVKLRNFFPPQPQASSESVVCPEGKILSDDASSKASEKKEISAKNLELRKKLEAKITPNKGVKYPYQLEKKFNKSIAVLRDLGQKLHSLKVPIVTGNDNLPCPVSSTVPAPAIESYSNYDEFSIGLGLDGNSKTVGFYTGSTVDGQNAFCVSPKDLNIIKDFHKELVQDFQKYLNESPLAANIRHDDGGYWRRLQIRSNRNDEIRAIITINPQEMSKEELSEEAEKLKDHFISQKNYFLKSLYLRTEHSPLKITSSGNKQSLLFGDPNFVEEFNGLKLQISPNSYFTSNPRAFELVYDNVLKVCKMNQKTSILDIFCGIGPLSLMMADHVQKCIGIDPSHSNIEDANANAEASGKINVRFMEGLPEFLISDILNQEYFEDLIVVINPSKTELTKASIQCLRACKHLKKIVYISTVPKSAIDNYVRLCKPSGSDSFLGNYFVPILAIPVDLYPQTDYVELIVMFERF